MLGPNEVALLHQNCSDLAGVGRYFLDGWRWLHVGLPKQASATTLSDVATQPDAPGLIESGDACASSQSHHCCSKHGGHAAAKARARAETAQRATTEPAMAPTPETLIDCQ